MNTNKFNSEMNYLILAQIGFSEQDAAKVIAFAERMNLTVPQLIRAALRQYQSTVEPLPDMFGGCMGD